MSDKQPRKKISKKVRFEVFKRDSFTCQYCGAKAPDVVLQLDHIKPLAKGGAEDVMNYVTSCASCNSGKGATELSDASVIDKQRRQLEELNERREQLEMMLQWREVLAGLEDQKLQIVESALMEPLGDSDVSLSESGQREVKKWLKRFSVDEVLSAIEAAMDQYLEWEDDRPTNDSWSHAFEMVPKICRVRQGASDKPYLRDLFYIRGILRNRLYYVNERECLKLLEQAHLAGASIESLRELAKVIRNWTALTEELDTIIYGEDNGEN